MSGSIRRTESHFESGGRTLFRRAWLPAEPGRLLVLVHGFAEHSGRYEHVGRWFAARGFDCAVLRYRMPADGWEAGADAPVQDVMRAIRMLRARSAQGARVGVIGFSAGGHATARAITASPADSAMAYPRVDAADDLSARLISRCSCIR